MSYRTLLENIQSHADELRLELISAYFPEPYIELSHRDHAIFRISSLLLDRLVGYLQDRIAEL